MFSLPILSGLALWWPWPFFIPAKSTYDATFLNKLAWLKSSTYARPHGPSYCVCLLFLILGSPTQHLAFCYHYSCGFRSHVHVCGAFSWYKKPIDIRRPRACWHYISKISLGNTRKITGQTRRIKPMSSAPPQSLLEFLPPGSILELLTWLSSISVFVHGVYHSKKTQTTLHPFTQKNNVWTIARC